MVRAYSVAAKYVTSRREAAGGLSFVLFASSAILHCSVTSAGVSTFKGLCGRKLLYSLIQALIFSYASSRNKNRCVFKHPFVKELLNNSMKGLSVGFPVLE